MTAKYVHPESKQEIDVAPEHADRYEHAGWVKKSEATKTDTKPADK